MAKKILRSLINNVGLKLASVIIATILWMVVMNIDNPQTTQTFTTVAKMENENIITDNGKVYDVLNNSDTVKFSVTGPRTIVEGMSASDFTAVADMNKIDLDLGLVPVEVTAERYSSKVTVNVKTTNVQVSIENLATKQFAVSATTTGEPKEGYAVGEVSCDPATVTISGPESVIGNIDRVAAAVNLDGMYSTRTQTVVPTLYDDDNNEIESNNVTIEPGTVSVNAKIMKTKSLELFYEYEGTLKKGYSIGEISILPEHVTVKGDTKALEEVDSIAIPSSAIDLSGATEDVEKTIKIDSYLPKGVELVDSSQNSVTVTIEIDSSAQKTFSIKVSKLKTKNLDSDYSVTYSDKTVDVTVNGKKDDLDDLKAEDIVLTLDFDGCEEGSFSLKPSVKEISGITFEVGKVKGKLKKSSSSEDDE
ncbi:MAG: hypothetical protein K6A30_05630 [Lachnospiraceae bacterium]|nr:hypothetical protein [Lachnospiraceae bacterium]